MATIPEIINLCGGAAAVGDAIGLDHGVRKWPRIGIPDRHWPKLIEMSGGKLTPADLYQANQHARGDAAPKGEAA